MSSADLPGGAGTPMPAQVVAAAQASVRDVVVAAASGRSGHRWVVPLAAVAAVAAAACAPVVWPLLGGAAVGSAALTAAFTQVGGVGGGLLAESVVRVWDRLRGREGFSTGQSEFREALAVELKEALGSSSPMAAGLRAEVAGVLQGVDAVKVALTTTIETSVRESGDQVRAALISGLQDLGTRFTEFGWLLEEVNDQVTRIAETQAEIAAGTRAMLESQQQTLMRLTVLLQQTRPVHAGGSALAAAAAVAADQDPPACDRSSGGRQGRDLRLSAPCPIRVQTGLPRARFRWSGPGGATPSGAVSAGCPKWAPKLATLLVYQQAKL